MAIINVELFKKCFEKSIENDYNTLVSIYNRRTAKKNVSSAHQVSKDNGHNEGSTSGDTKNVTTKHEDYSKKEVNFKTSQSYEIKMADIVKKKQDALSNLPNAILYIKNLPKIRELLLKTSLKTLDDFRLLDLAAELSNDVNLIDAYVHSVEFTGPHVFNPTVIKTLFSRVLHPPAFDYRLYGYSCAAKRVCNPTYRYMGNHDLESLYNIANNSDGVNTDKSVTARAILRIFDELSSQNRFGNLLIYLKCLMEVKQCHKNAEYHVNLQHVKACDYEYAISAEETVCFQTLIFLLKQFPTFPFRIKNNLLRMRVSMAGFSTVLPLIIYALINGVSNELSGNLSRYGAETYVKYLAHCSSTSLITEYLTYKGDARSWFKYMLNYLQRVGMIKYATSGEPVSVVVEDVEGEHFRVNEDKTYKMPPHLPNAMKQYIMTKMNEMSKLGSQKPDEQEYYFNLSEYCRFLFMEMNIISNCSLFYKTSLVLEYEKSIQPRLVKPPVMTGARKYMMRDNKKIMVQNGFEDDLFRLLELKFDECYGKFLEDRFLEGVNWESEFVTALTNKSGGLKSSDLSLSPLLRSISNTRLLNFVTGIKEFSDPNYFRSMLTLESSCAIRFQNDRRSRLIVIVPNSIQSSEIFLLYSFNQIKQTEKSSMFVGKTVGDIRDVALQLSSSSNQSTLKNNSDVAGMDAHTVPAISDFIRYIIIKYLISSDKSDNSYFCTGRSREIIFSSLDNCVHATNCDMPASAMHAINVMDIMRTLQLAIPDLYFGITMNSTDETFMSGLYGTSAQHTILLDILMKVVADEYYSKYPMLFKPINRIMGDDRFEVIENAKQDLLGVEKYLTLTDKMLEKLNYAQDAETSFYHAKFLQQNGLFGMFVPLVSRTSIWCSERSETVSRQPIESIQIMSSVVNTYAQRCYSIENAQQFLPVIWNNLRSHEIYVTDSNIDLIRNIVSKFNVDDVGVTTLLRLSSFGKAKITYPYMCIHVAPIGWPMPGMIDDEGQRINAGASTTMGGDFSKIHTFDFFSTTKEFLFTENNFADLVNWKKRAMYGFTFSEYLVGFTRARLLSDVRADSLRVNIIQASDVLSKYLDKRKKEMSVTGISTLESKGIKVPEGVTYIGQPKSKIKQALASRLESLPEASTLDLKFLRYILAFSIVPNEKEILKIIICSVQMDYIKDETNLLENRLGFPERQTTAYLPIMPGYHIYSSYGMLLMVGQSPLSVGKTTSGSISMISGELGANYDVEAAVRFGAAVFKKLRLKNRDILTVVADVMGLSRTARPHYNKLVHEHLKLGDFTEYQAIFDNTKYFCISGHAGIFEKLSILNRNHLISVNLQYITKYKDIMIRDAYFASIDYRKPGEILQFSVPKACLFAMLPGKVRNKLIKTT